MASISNENEKLIRDNITVDVTIAGKDVTAYSGQWYRYTAQGGSGGYEDDSPTPHDGAAGYIRTNEDGTAVYDYTMSFRVNEATEYVKNGTFTYYPDNDGNVIIKAPISPIVYLYGKGAGARINNPLLYNGIYMVLTKRTLTVLSLALRSDLTLVNPSIQTSEINISFYSKHISPDILAYMATTINGAAMLYRASYGDDTERAATERHFYCTTDGISINSNEISLTGVDQMEKLSGTQKPRYFTFPSRSGRNRMYALFRSFITNAGVTNVTVEEPPAEVSGTSEYTCETYMDEKTYGEYVNYFMRYMHGESFMPRYVDAGRPTITWNTRGYRWQIDEEECGTITHNYQPAIKNLSIYSTGVQASTTRRTIQELTECELNGIYAFELEEPYRGFTVTNATIISQNPMRVAVKCTTAGTITLRGYRIAQLQPDIQPRMWEVENAPTYGITAEVDGEWFFTGAVQEFDTDDFYWIDEQLDAFIDSAEVITFTWKGDPRMQPLDAFQLRHRDGTTDVYTIESITLDHTGGGMSAEITARKGIL